MGKIDNIIGDSEHNNIKSESAERNFKNQINSTFDLNNLNNSNNIPINLGKFNFNNFPIKNLNHYMVKSNDNNVYEYGELNNSIKEFIKFIKNHCEKEQISLSDRYCYVTINNGNVKKLNTQREGGWHIDGMQGDEVLIKTNPDFQFMRYSSLPTEFAVQSFNTEGLDKSIHNVFERINKRVKNIVQTDIGHIYKINPYNAHRAVPAKEDTKRQFIRVSFTKTPITSTKLTINNNIVYNYNKHTTTGNIPKHLI